MIHWFFTISRLFISPFVFLAMKKRDFGWVMIFISYAIISDFLDGFFARKLSQTTRIGALLDAVMDKIFINTAAVAFCLYIEPNAISFRTILGIWFLRDAAIIILSIIATKPFASLYYGKLYTALQFMFLFIIFTNTAYPSPIFGFITNLFVWIMCFVFMILGAISTRQYYNSMI